MAPAGSSHIDFTLAVLTAAGGIMGYVKSRSVPSVSAIGESLCAIGAIGLAFGGCYAATGYLINQGEGVKGHGAGLATSALLTAAMGMRFAKTRKPFPAGVLSAAGAAASAYHFNKYQEWAG